MDETIYVQLMHCDEHDDLHYLDRSGHCWGATLADVEGHGFEYPRHKGSGLYCFIPRYNPQERQQTFTEWEAYHLDRIKEDDIEY